MYFRKISELYLPQHGMVMGSDSLQRWMGSVDSFSGGNKFSALGVYGIAQGNTWKPSSLFLGAGPQGVSKCPRQNSTDANQKSMLLK